MIAENTYNEPSRLKTAITVFVAELHDACISQCMDLQKS